MTSPPDVNFKQQIEPEIRLLYTHHGAEISRVLLR